MGERRGKSRRGQLGIDGSGSLTGGDRAGRNSVLHAAEPRN
jgi:hypothetical protein